MRLHMTLDAGLIDVEDAEIDARRNALGLRNFEWSVRETEEGRAMVDISADFKYELEQFTLRFLGGKAGFGFMASAIVEEAIKRG